MRHHAATRSVHGSPDPARRTWPVWATAAVALVAALALWGPPGADGARGQEAPPAPDPTAVDRAALDALEQIRRAYPIDFGEAHTIHQAIHTHLTAGGDPADIRHIVKIAVIQGCRETCMEATFAGFTRLNAAGLSPGEVQTLLTAAIRDGRGGMPPRYTYEMLGAAVTDRVNRRLGGPTATP